MGLPSAIQQLGLYAIFPDIFADCCPHIRNQGTAIAMDISWALVALLNLCSVFYFTGISFSFGNFVVVPLVGSFLMGGVVYSLFQLIWAWTGDVIITTIGSLFAGGTAYFVYLLFSGTIKKDDLSKIPGIGPFLNSIY